MDWRGLERDLQQFEQEEWGTNDMVEIREKINMANFADAQKLMTGMEEEQADWEEGRDE